MEQKLKLLIIDDEPSTRKILEHFLNKEFDVTLKNDGMEGMNWLELGNKPDFIIADLNMPNLNGKEFIKVISASNIYNNIPIIILSGTDESKERIDCLNLGADDFMLKPFNPMEIHAKIKAILRRLKAQ
ncbi:Alkaline phosphatase synthesis transcriptional regulatory protein PhoP [Emticicia aquatica]|jgi:DNA-binding response OmpR family regulator|uniref:Alkaline phosphatase synthesis transcriptional regulatory protein PhoP n=1 Tax=Emticicia aquatica TaxID=1681835 RepID=A0ABM9APY3_9BACT|nr:response regulator transcription factor [Emticicia aquatica]CAH0995979.1 Alkaline phosphatase synthesis transcriptional regulatory protein PhoP [Emticicia aquatica]